MARPRTASNVLDLRGAFKKDPQRRRIGEPEPVGEVGSPPDWLSDEAKVCWEEIKGLAHHGTLCQADRLVMEYLSNLLAQCRAATWIVHPSVLIRFEQCLGKLGLTPSDRSKIQVTPGAPKNDFEDM